MYLLVYYSCIKYNFRRRQVPFYKYSIGISFFLRASLCLYTIDVSHLVAYVRLLIISSIGISYFLATGGLLFIDLLLQYWRFVFAPALGSFLLVQYWYITFVFRQRGTAIYLVHYWGILYFSPAAGISVFVLSVCHIFRLHRALVQWQCGASYFFSPTAGIILLVVLLYRIFLAWDGHVFISVVLVYRIFFSYSMLLFINLVCVYSILCLLRCAPVYLYSIVVPYFFACGGHFSVQYWCILFFACVEHLFTKRIRVTHLFRLRQASLNQYTIGVSKFCRFYNGKKSKRLYRRQKKGKRLHWRQKQK